MSSYREHQKQYLIVINLSQKISNDVKQFKAVFREKFGEAKYLHLWPHITLSLFSASEEIEIQLKEELSAYALKLRAFPVQIEHFACFKKNGVIYLQPEIEQISKFQDEIPEILEHQIGLEKKYILTARHPHITIARSKKREQFTKAWDYFQNLSYHNFFVVKSFHVYRRDLKDYAPWEPCFDLTFNT